MPSMTPTPHPIDPDSSQSFLVQNWKTSFLDLRVDLISKIATQLIKISIHPEPSSPQSSEPKNEANGVKSESMHTYDFRPLRSLFSANQSILSLDKKLHSDFIDKLEKKIKPSHEEIGLVFSLASLNKTQVIMDTITNKRNSNKEDTDLYVHFSSNKIVCDNHKKRGQAMTLSLLNKVELLIPGLLTKNHDKALNELELILDVVSQSRTNDQPLKELAARILYAALVDNPSEKSLLILIIIQNWCYAKDLKALVEGRQKDKETKSTFREVFDQNGKKIVTYLKSERKFLLKIHEILNNEAKDERINVQQIKECRQSLPSTPNNLMDGTVAKQAKFSSISEIQLKLVNFDRKQAHFHGFLWEVGLNCDF